LSIVIPGRFYLIAGQRRRNSTENFAVSAFVKLNRKDHKDLKENFFEVFVVFAVQAIL
jgi:hypothetical protein